MRHLRVAERGRQVLVWGTDHFVTHDDDLAVLCSPFREQHGITSSKPFLAAEQFVTKPVPPLRLPYTPGEHLLVRPVHVEQLERLAGFQLMR